MDQLYKQIRTTLLALIVAGNVFIVALAAFLIDVMRGQFFVAVGILIIISMLMSLGIAAFATRFALQPLAYLRLALLHVLSPTTNPAPDMTELRSGQQMITELSMQAYQLSNQQQDTSLADHRKAIIQASSIVDHMPLPLFVFNKDQLVTHASSAGIEYCGIETSGLFGKKLFEVVNLEFPSENTLEKWIEDCQNNKVTAAMQWERVRIMMPGDAHQYKQCDITAYYNRDNPSGTEFIVTLFDRTAQYEQDEQSLSFVALAVHELRTPLTMLRGYIEVFQDELGPTLSPELQDFMRKMDAASTQLAGFVNNILNVARVEQDQLTLQLSEQNWDETLQSSVELMRLRAQVHNKELVCNLEPNLPTVAIDRMSIQEVITNLVDNAIKYSGPEEKQIIITAHVNKEGMVETSVQDFGVGMPASVVQNLFEKFYRNHRTRAQFGGSGLGLYLSKAIITAHGGQMSVQSKEGEGSTFSFTIQPYADVADEVKNKADKDITRSAHGWIKNHSLYRR